MSRYKSSSYLDLKERGLNPLQVGAYGDNIHDDTTVLQECLSLPGVVYIPRGTYKVTSKLTVDISQTVVISDGAVINGSAITSGAILSVTSNAPLPYHQATNSVKGLEIQGSGASATNVIGISLDPGTTYGPSHSPLQYVNIHDVGTGLQVNQHDYANNFYGVDIWNTTTCVSVTNASDSGERITFFGGCWYNSTNGLVTSNPNSDIYLHSVSMDFLSAMITATGGRVYAIGCHFESSSDTNYWFSATGNGVLIRVSNSEIAVDANKTAYNIGYSDSAVQFGGVEWIDCSLVCSQYGLPYLFAGTGRYLVKNLSRYQYDMNAPVGMQFNAIAHGTFEDANSLSVWTLSGDVPTLDTTQHYSGSQSMKFAVQTSGHSCSASISVPVNPAQHVLASYYALIPTVPSPDDFYVTASYLDSSGNTLWSGTTNLTAAITSWTQKILGLVVPPVGTSKFQLTFNTGNWNTGSAVWIDDVCINVI